MARGSFNQAIAVYMQKGGCAGASTQGEQRVGSWLAMQRLRASHCELLERRER